MKIIKIVAGVFFLITSALIGLWLLGWYTQSPQQKACADYIWRTGKYPAKTEEIYSQLATLDLRRDDYEKQIRTLLNKWQALIPPDELKNLHEKMHQSLLLEIDLIRAVKAKNIALANKYRGEIKDPMKFFEEVTRLYREHGCE